MSTTEKVIFEQFPLWKMAIGPIAPHPQVGLTAFVGCGTSFNLALTLAALSNAAGHSAIAVPGGEWLNRPNFYAPEPSKVHVVAISRSGETTETVAAAKASRKIGAFVTALTVEPDSSLAHNSDRVLAAQSHPEEGIVMSASASLMLLLGIQLIGYTVPPSIVAAARGLLDNLDAKLPALIANRSHFIFLGAGPLFGIALEGALKLMEMSQIFTQAFHPLEYRHGPISLVDDKTAAVMLLSADQKSVEASLVGELEEKGAIVIGLGGAADVGFEIARDPALLSLAVLPALQILGERAAQARNIDTVSPRHLTKVVTLV